MELTEGQQAPAFTLPDQDGREVSLEDYRGRRVVLYFYPKDDTPGCTAEACQFNESLPDFAEAGMDVIGISADGGDSHRRFREKYGLRFTLLTDADHQVATSYGAYKERSLYGRLGLGIVRSTFLVGPQGSIEKAWYSVRADGHAASVLAEARASD